MMNNPIIALFKQWVDQRKERQFDAFREFLDTYQASHAWTLLKCSMCGLPATAPDARFCAYCGASLYVSSAKLHPALEQERNTGPVQLSERPCKVLAQARREQDTGPNTALLRAVEAAKEKATHHP